MSVALARKLFGSSNERRIKAYMMLRRLDAPVTALSMRVGIVSPQTPALPRVLLSIGAIGLI
jgi:hypothetical protein